MSEHPPSFQQGEGVVIQERAALTRVRLVRAAAEEMDRHGYAGTSLSRVCRTAGVSMGALTFHFAAKSQLAGAVREQGAAAVRRVVEDIPASPEEPVAAVVGLTVALARLLEDDPSVRVAVRLADDDAPPFPSWSGLWGPPVRRLLGQARDRERLAAGVEVDAVTDLVSHLLAGSAALLRSGTEKRSGAGAPLRLERIWDVALQGITAPGDPR